MNWFECAIRDQTRAAVATCHHCRVRLRLEHLQAAQAYLALELPRGRLGAPRSASPPRRSGRGTSPSLTDRPRRHRPRRRPRAPRSSGVVSRLSTLDRFLPSSIALRCALPMIELDRLSWLPISREDWIPFAYPCSSNATTIIRGSYAERP